MKIGKLSENALERSVLRQIGHRREEVLSGPAIGVDCASIQVKNGAVLTLSSDPITGVTEELGSYCIHVTANDIAASGAEPFAVMLTCLFPESVEESEIRRIMQDAECTCRKLNMEIIGGHTEVTRAVNQPLISVTGLGTIMEDPAPSVKNIHPGQDVIITKWVGLEATSILAREKRDVLKRYFSDDFIANAAGLDRYLSVLPEARIAVSAGVTAMHDVTEGGIFGAMWEIAEAGDVGMDIDLRSIPIRQETVEICEVFHVNPYQIMSSGSMLMIADNGPILVQELRKNGISAVIIGRTTDGNDRIMHNGDEIRYMDKPQKDELYKALES